MPFLSGAQHSPRCCCLSSCTNSGRFGPGTKSRRIFPRTSAVVVTLSPRLPILVIVQSIKSPSTRATHDAAGTTGLEQAIASVECVSAHVLLLPFLCRCRQNHAEDPADLESRSLRDICQAKKVLPQLSGSSMSYKIDFVTVV